MEEGTFLHAHNRTLLEKSRKIAEETRALVTEYLAQGEMLAQREKRLRDQLMDIEFQRLRLNDMLEDARASLVRMESNVHHLQCALSPIRTMPSEILLRIFHHIVLRGEAYIRTEFRDWHGIEPFTTPVLLSSVCSHWRAVVKQNAKLWDYIHVKAPTLHDAEQQGKKKDIHLQSIRHWMAFGKQDRQSLFVDEYHPMTKSKVYTALKSSSPSWKSITIAISNDDPSVHWELGKMQASDVSIYVSRAFPGIDSIIPLLRYATNLTLTGTLPRWGDMPWTSLRTLSLLSFAGESDLKMLEFGAQELRCILNAAIHLEELMLNFLVADNTSEMEEQAKVQHQALRSFSFHLNHLRIDGSLFGMQISAPRLEHINILSTDATKFDESLTQIEAFKHSTSVVINEIEIHEVPTIVRFLRCLPKVTGIDVQGPNIDALFTLINGFYTHVPPRYATVPLLKLTKVTMDQTDIRGKTLVEMLETRLAQLEGGFGWISAITDVVLWDADNVTPKEWRQINTLLESGRMASLPDPAAMQLS